MTLLGEATWPAISAIREACVTTAPSVQSAAQHFTQTVTQAFPSILLARVFFVAPFSRFPEAERAHLGSDARLVAKTPVLSLLGTSGREPAWNDRTRSVGHRAIALIDRETVHGAPMIASLLNDLGLELGDLANPGISSRMLEGGRNAIFFVPDARTTKDSTGRPIIQPAFAERYAVQSVFGMGGRYLDGTMAITIWFCTERVDLALANRYGSLIGTFKIATMDLVTAGKIWS